MKRRQFNSMLGSAGLSLSQKSDRMKPPAKNIQPERIQLSRNGWMPNNEHLPVLLYRKAITVEGDKGPLTNIWRSE